MNVFQIWRFYHLRERTIRILEMSVSTKKGEKISPEVKWPMKQKDAHLW
jgi:hypothetical protein